MSPVVMAVAGTVALALVLAATGLILLLVGQRRRQKAFKRRLHTIAAPLTGNIAAPESVEEDAVVLRSQSNRWQLWDLLEARYPLLSAPATFPKALGIGLLGGAAGVAALWFLRVPFGWWTPPAGAVSGLVAAWLCFSWLQKRWMGEFVAKFPDTVDQIVRLSATGTPILEAVASVADHAPHPVKPVLGMYSDQLTAGIDADEAARAVSGRFRIPEVTIFMAVVRLQRRSGGGLSTAFSNLSNTLRERRQISLKAKASTAQTRFTLLILAVMPLILLGVQSYSQPKSVEILFGTDAGVQLLRWGVALIAGGIYAARAIAANATR